MSLFPKSIKTFPANEHSYVHDVFVCIVSFARFDLNYILFSVTSVHFYSELGLVAAPVPKIKGKSRKRRTFSKIWYQIKGPIIIFYLKGHVEKLKCVNYEIFFKKT